MTSLKKIKRSVHKARANKIVGHFAIRRGGTSFVLCDEDACVIGSTRKDIEKYITTLGHGEPADYIIKQTTFGEIYKGMMMGGVYALDEKSYKVYLPLAQARGMNLTEFKIEGEDQPPHPDAVRLMRIAWFPEKQE